MDTREADDQALMGRLEALTDIPGQLSSPYIRAAAEDALAALSHERARRERLEAALRRIASTGDDGMQDQVAPDQWRACLEIARKALEDQE